LRQSTAAPQFFCQTLSALMRACTALALLALPALGIRSEEGGSSPGSSGKESARWSTCDKIQNLGPEDVEHCKELVASMQKLLSSLNCDDLKSNLTEESRNIEWKMKERGAKEAVKSLLGGVDVELIHNGIEAADAAVEVSKARGTEGFEYQYQDHVEALSKVTAGATLAIFAVGLAVDIFLMGTSGMAGTLMAGKAAGALTLIDSTVSWTYDLASKIPDFRKFSRLVTTKCRFLDNMKELNNRLLNVGSDDVPWPEREADDVLRKALSKAATKGESIAWEVIRERLSKAANEEPDVLPEEEE